MLMRTSWTILVAALLVWTGVALARPGVVTMRQTAVTNHPSTHNPAVTVSARTLDFGSVYLGSTNKLSFTIKNVGAGVVKGVAGVSTPFSILTGSRSVLAPAQTQVITVQYAPKEPGMHMAMVRFTGADGVTVTVIGSACQPLPSPAHRPGAPLERPVLRLIARL